MRVCVPPACRLQMKHHNLTTVPFPSLCGWNLIQYVLKRIRRLRLVVFRAVIINNNFSLPNHFDDKFFSIYSKLSSRCFALLKQRTNVEAWFNGLFPVLFVTMQRASSLGSSCTLVWWSVSFSRAQELCGFLQPVKPSCLRHWSVSTQMVRSVLTCSLKHMRTC